MKHDGRHKACLVAGRHLTNVPIDSLYSSVVSMKGLRLVFFLAELNGLDVWTTDMGNAYLEAKTKERVLVVAGPKFGDLNDILKSSSKHCLASAVQDSVGMSILLIPYVTWVSHRPRQRMTSGCGTTETSTNILQLTLMSCALQHRIPPPSSRF